MHRSDCPYDHPQDAPKAAALRSDLAAKERSGAIKVSRGKAGSDGGESAAPVRKGEREW